MNKSEFDYSLYLVTDRPLLKGRDLCQTITQAISGGVTLVQLREKNLSTLEFYELAKQVKEVLTPYHIPLMINDRLDIALAVDAEGLHIGQEDLPLPIARQLFGENKVIGLSVSNLAEAQLAQQQGADYLGVGAVFPTSTKLDADSVTLAQLKEMKEAVSIPVVAIGGITQDNVEQVLKTGVDGVAVISAILGQADCCKAAKLFKDQLK